MDNLSEQNSLVFVLDQKTNFAATPFLNSNLLVFSTHANTPASSPHSRPATERTSRQTTGLQLRRRLAAAVRVPASRRSRHTLPAQEQKRESQKRTRKPGDLTDQPGGHRRDGAHRRSVVVHWLQALL